MAIPSQNCFQDKGENVPEKHPPDFKDPYIAFPQKWYRENKASGGYSRECLVLLHFS